MNQKANIKKKKPNQINFGKFNDKGIESFYGSKYEPKKGKRLGKSIMEEKEDLKKSKEEIAKKRKKTPELKVKKNNQNIKVKKSINLDLSKFSNDSYNSNFESLNSTLKSNKFGQFNQKKNNPNLFKNSTFQNVSYDDAKNPEKDEDEENEDEE